MSEPIEVLVYLCDRAPAEHTMPIARLMRLVYLADWRSATHQGKTLTETKWEYAKWGPWSSEIDSVIKESGNFVVQRSETSYGEPRHVVSVARRPLTRTLGSLEQSILDSVLTNANKGFDELARAVFSTHPVVTHGEGDVLDLVKIANRLAKGDAEGG